MAKRKKRTVMRKIRDVLRLHFASRLSNQQIAAALRISKTNVFNTLNRFKESELTWPIPDNVSDPAPEAVIYRQESSTAKEVKFPNFEYIDEELSRPHMTLELLWKEYSQCNPAGLSRRSMWGQA